MEGLMQMINGSITVTVHDATSKAPLASAVVDQLWRFAVAENTWSTEGVDLKPLDGLPEGVPKLRTARLSAVSVALHQRPQPEGVDPAAPPPPESDLPPLQPYSYLGQEAADDNMVELMVSELSPLPPHLATVAETAGGKLVVSVGVRLLPGGPAVMVPMALAGGRLTAPTFRRELLPAAVCRQLQYQLEDGVPFTVEVARYVSAEGFSDPAWESYHAGAVASGLVTELVVAGATQGSASGLPLVPFAETGAATCLLPYTPPAGKAKPIEDAASAGPSAWRAAGSRLSVSLRFAKPIVPAWQPPPPPPRSLLELIPARDLTPKPQPTTAQDDFKTKVRSIARALASEYKAVLPPADLEASGGSDPDVVTARHKALIFELNRSGKYGQMRDSLKAAVVALVREKYKKSGSMSPNEMALLYNDLYGTLLAATHSALNDLIDAATARPRAPPPEPVPDKQRLAQLLYLAAQAEATGNQERAEALHQRRIAAKTDPQVWYEYGTYCLRRGSRGRAEQCFREALSLEPAHRASLLALLGCSVAEGRATDPSYLETAEAAAHRLLEVEGRGAMGPWAAMSLVYKAAGEAKRSELASCEQEMARLEREAAAGGTGEADGVTPSPRSVDAPAGEQAATSALQARSFVSLAQLLLEVLSLPSEALLALGLAAGLRSWAAAPSATHLEHGLAGALAEQALGRGAALLPPVGTGGGGGSPVLELLRAGAAAPDVAWRATLLAAQLRRAQGAVEDAIRYYQTYIDEARQAGRLPRVPLPVWLELAACYSRREQPRCAADVLLLGASAHPGCAALWLRAGEAFLAAGELRDADMALSEANLLDCEDPAAWGGLALVAAREGRHADADTALSYGLRCGLDDPELLLGIAEALRAAGRRREEQRVLQELTSKVMPESCSARLLLARCLLAQRCLPEAEAAVAAARELAAVEEDEAAVAELEAELRGEAM